MDALLNRALDRIEKQVVEPLSQSAVEIVDEFPGEEAGAAEAALLAAGASLGGADLAAVRRTAEAWAAFGLAAHRDSWDATGQELARDADKRAQARRDLGRRTREAKGDAAACAALVPAYQAELDELAKRAKAAESAFLGAYRHLAEVPDPAVALSAAAAALERAATVAAGAARAEKDLEAARREIAGLKDAKAHAKRLEQRNAELEAEMNAKVEQIVELRARDASKELEAAKAREAAQQARLDDVQRNLESLRRLHDAAQTQLFEVQGATEDIQATRSAELELVHAELERAQARSAELEVERQLLRDELRSAGGERGPGGGDDAATASGGGGGGGDAAALAAELEESLLAKERVIGRLHVELQDREHSLEQEREAHAATTAESAAIQERCRKAIEAADAELERRPTTASVDALKRRVAMLQALVDAEDDEVWLDADDADAAAAAKDDGATGAGVTRILRDRNRRLNGELLEARNSLDARGVELAAAQERADGLQRELAERQEQVAKLEQDLSVVGSAGGEEGGDAMLAIVCGQRERFRERNTALSEEVSGLQERCRAAEASLEAIKKDNVELYEKIKYLQQWSTKQVSLARAEAASGRPLVQRVDQDGIARPASKSTRFSCGPVALDVNETPAEEGGGVARRRTRLTCFGGADAAGGGAVAVAIPVGESETESKYKKLYDASVNPFADFRKRVEEQQVSLLPFHDRVGITAGNWLVASRTARIAGLAYFAAVHLYILLVLFVGSLDDDE